ncbi:hypothetical protein N3K64_04745 [Escherichia coli]|uniref:hypothetical protein n=1 Tax=Escherichia coli TaxID=562 RepID=UPI0021C11BD5|nr:hypothetical protein [Escherichia coli]MCT9829198.1 hypothetical protein [Escherichia coli]
MTLDIAKLKAAAEKAKEYGGIAMYSKAIKANAVFKEAANPATVLELIAQNEALVAAHVNLKLLADVYRHAYEEARARIAELEARTVTVELPRWYAGPYGSMVYDADAVEAALELAGINLETGGE